MQRHSTATAGRIVKRTGRLTLALTGFPYAISGVFTRALNVARVRRTTRLPVVMATPTPSMNGTSTASKTSWIHHDGRLLGIATLGAVVGVSLLAVLALVISNWGWWRIRGPASRRRYVRTWHGWVDRAEHNEKTRRRQEKTGWLRDAWKSVITRIEWVFWDPRGTKRAKYKQRKKSAFGEMLTRGQTDNADNRAEMGIEQRFSSRRAPREDNGVYEMAGGPGSESASGSVVRRRRNSTAEAAAWHAGSSETSRATVTQFLMPTHGFQTPIWVENLFGKQGPILPTCRTSATATSDNNGNKTLPRADVLLCGSNLARRTIQSSPTPMQPLPEPSLRELHSSTALSTAIEFESLATYIDRGSRYGRYVTNPPKRLIDVEAGGVTYVPKRSQSLTQRLKGRQRPSINSLFPSLHRRLSRGRKTIIPDDGLPPPDPLAEYENEGSIDVAVTWIGTMQSSLGSYVSKASVPRVGTFQSSMASYLSRESNMNNYIQGIQRLSPIPTQSLEALHPPKKRSPLRLSGRKSSEKNTSPSTPGLRAVSGNSSIIPSFALPESKLAANEPSHAQRYNESPYTKVLEELGSRLDWLDVGNIILRTPSEKLSRARIQLSLDESTLRRACIPEPLRVIRRVGKLRSESHGCHVRASTENRPPEVSIPRQEDDLGNPQYAVEAGSLPVC